MSRHLSERDVQSLAIAAHVGYGALTGAVFGLVAPTGHRAIGTGVLFGLGVWTASYLGWLPATGVRHSPRYDVPTRTGLIIASHLVWGATAGLLLSGRR